jgi:hypothetical protein
MHTFLVILAFWAILMVPCILAVTVDLNKSEGES